MVSTARAALADALAREAAQHKADALNASLAELDTAVAEIAGEFDAAVTAMVAKAAELTAGIAKARGIARSAGIEVIGAPILGQLAHEITQEAVTAIRNGHPLRDPFTTATRMVQAARSDIERRGN